MKKLLLCLALLATAAMPALAGTSNGQLPPANNSVRNDHGAINGNDGNIGHMAPPADSEPLGDQPTRPVPEPGTMVLASMGLMALGAAARKRRGR